MLIKIYHEEKNVLFCLSLFLKPVFFLLYILFLKVFLFITVVSWFVPMRKEQCITNMTIVQPESQFWWDIVHFTQGNSLTEAVLC